MKLRTGIMLGIAGVLAAMGIYAYYFYRRQVDLLKNDLQYKVVGYEVIELSADKTVLKIILQIHSKSTIEAKVKSLYVDIFVDGKKIGNIENAEFEDLDGVVRDYFIIPAKGYSDVAVKLEFSPKLAVSMGAQALLAFVGKKNMVISFVGNIKVQSAFVSATVPFEYQTTLSELMAPSVKKST